MLCFSKVEKKKKKKKIKEKGKKKKSRRWERSQITKRAAQSHKTCSNCGSYCTIDFSAELFFDFYREFSLKIDETICPY